MDPDLHLLASSHKLPIYQHLRCCAQQNQTPWTKARKRYLLWITEPGMDFVAVAEGERLGCSVGGQSAVQQQQNV